MADILYIIKLEVIAALLCGKWLNSKKFRILICRQVTDTPHVNTKPNDAQVGDVKKVSESSETY